MIKINKLSTPQILIENRQMWTQELMDAVNHYGGYSKIPQQEKDALLSHYKHKDIQSALARSSHNKCAFCECMPGESGNIEVEHFEPKSLYPERTFEWDNLLPVCRKCNEAKSNFDTHLEPIINPAKEDPEQVLTYKDLELSPIPGSATTEKTKKTIEVCNLNCPRLYRVRADLMVSITEYIEELRGKIASIAEADTPQKRNIRITKLGNSLEQIDALLNEEAAFSGFCRWFITQFPEYKDAKKIVTGREG